LENIVLEKLFSHLLLKNVLPPYLQDLQKMKTNQNLVNNLKQSSFTSHLIGAKSSKITMAKDIVCILATSQYVGTSKEVVKVLEVDKKNIRKVVEKR
jgi:hypothetical protein